MVQATIIMEDNLVATLGSKHKSDPLPDPHFYPKVAELSTKLFIRSKREKNMKTNARQNTGKQYYFFERSEQSLSKGILIIAQSKKQN